MTKLNKATIIRQLEKTQMREDLPIFKAGDTISVHTKIVEGSKIRVQRFDGIVMKITGKDLSKTFIVRKESSGVGVEQTFYYHSPLIVKITVNKKGKVRRAYISYMRQRSGKAARIKSATK
ncbi:MAG: 50S ribosomal protein L19 [Mycoplasmataceae bacterium]|jgi:large subunit ribosomal protein L19|nr:50S ribosomal protein L19 [Mycoplasmataceae bacterium]